MLEENWLLREFVAENRAMLFVVIMLAAVTNTNITFKSIFFHFFATEDTRDSKHRGDYCNRHYPPCCFYSQAAVRIQWFCQMMTGD